MPSEKTTVTEHAQRASRFISNNLLLVTFVFLFATVGTGFVITQCGWDTLLILPVTMLITVLCSPLLVSIHQSLR